MKDFRLMRYINQYTVMILTIVIIGCAGVAYYLTSKQTYIASTIIEYTSAEAAQGLTPLGTPIDTTKIYSSRNIANALDAINYTLPVETVRSRVSVTPVIPETEQQKELTAIKLGEPYSYIPTKYMVSLSLEHDIGTEESARKILDSILQCYFRYYSEECMDNQIVPSISEDVSTADYDYFEDIELIEDNVSDIIDFLEAREFLYKSYRSTTTGYSFTDLVVWYRYISSDVIPNLYVQALECKASKDQELFLKNLQARISKLKIAIDTISSKIEDVDTLIAEYSAKASESIEMNQVDLSNLDLVLKDVYDRADLGEDGDTTKITTYDNLIRMKTNLHVSKVRTTIESAYLEYVLSVYKNSDVKNADIDKVVDTQFVNDNKYLTEEQLDKMTKDTKEVLSALLHIGNKENKGDGEKELKEDIKIVVDKLGEMHTLLEKTVEENIRFQSGQNIKVLNSIYVEKELNVIVYQGLAAIAFIIIGCGLAIVLGRVMDFTSYMSYYDSRLGIANRKYIDVVLDRMHDVIFKTEVISVVTTLESLYTDDVKQKREEGDKLLTAYASLLKEVFNDIGVVAYNGGNQFIIIVVDCDYRKYEAFEKGLIKKVAEYNRDHEFKIVYKLATLSSLDGEYKDFRQLIKETFIKNSKGKELGV